MRTVTFMFELAEEHMPAVADAALRLHGPWRQAVTHGCPVTASEPPHGAAIRADVPDVRTADLTEVAEQFRAKLAGEARVPVDALRVYAAC